MTPTAKITREALSHEQFQAIVAELKEGIRASFEEMSSLRLATARAKLPQVLELLTDIVDAGTPLIIFAHHHEIIDAIKAAFPNSAVVDGRVPLNKRQEAVDNFQARKVNPIIGEFQAMGTGWTLTASSHVVFVEEDWVPGVMDQAADRAHRIGQTESVLVQHMVLEGSLDSHMVQRSVEKQKNITDALDREYEPVNFDALMAKAQKDIAANQARRQRAAEKAQLAKEQGKEEAAAEPMTFDPNLVAAVHHGLQLIASMCDGARELDGSGFNKIDAWFGKVLASRESLTTNNQAKAAARMVNKYRRQVPATYVEAAKAILEADKTRVA